MTPWPHTLTAHPAETVLDGDGNPVRRPSGPGVAVAGFLQLVRSTEDTSDGPAARIDATVWLEPAAPELDAFSRLDHNGTAYETVGAALFLSDPDRSVQFWRVTLRKVG